MSLASAAAAESREKVALLPGYYRLKLGPTRWHLSSGLSLEACDNVQVASQHAQADLIARPEAAAHLLWPVSEQNHVEVTMGGGYAAYSLHPEFNRLFITPGSEISFDLYVANVWFNLHDRFSVTESSYQDPTVVGVADYVRLENAAGLVGVWDLDQLILQLGYDHINYLALAGNPAGQPDGQTETVSATALYAPGSSVRVGGEAGGGWLHYMANNSNWYYSSASQWNVGAVVNLRLSHYVALKGSAGYTVFAPTSSGVLTRTVDFQGIYFQCDCTHRVNRFFHYTLSGGRTVNFTCYGGTVDLAYARWVADWQVLRKTSLATHLDFQHGTQMAVSGEAFARFGPGLTIGRTVAAGLSVSLGYRYYWRNSNLANRDYHVNLLTLSSQYEF